MRDSFVFGEVVGLSNVAKSFGAESESVVLFKKFDDGKNTLPKAEFDNLAKFISANSIPLIDEIGPHNFKTYLETGLPLVYLFVDVSVAGQKDEYISKIRELAQQTKGKLSWVYIDWAKYAKHSERLGLSGTTVPALAIEKPEVGTHYAFDETTEITTANVEAWVNKFFVRRLATYY